MLEIDKIYCINCIEGMKQLPENFVDAVVTDPPYGLEFMGKEWDKLKRFDSRDKATKSACMNRENAPIAISPTYIGGAPAQEWHYDWAIEVLRVLKPGGHLLSFGGSRTYHRMACAVEDAGFEIRDMIEWVYGQGFPKSLDISKSIDKQAGRIGKSVVDLKLKLKELVNQSEKTGNQIDKECGFRAMNYLTLPADWKRPDPWVNILPSQEKWKIMKIVLGIKDNVVEKELDETFREVEREIIATITKARTKNQHVPLPTCGEEVEYIDIDITVPTAPEAKEWSGWGTALKPSHEPIVLARKPLSEKTVAGNVLKWGTGGLNIDECRIHCGTEHMRGNVGAKVQDSDWKENSGFGKPFVATDNPLGRFPANLIHDGSDDVEDIFAKAGESKSSKGFRGCKTSEGSNEGYKRPSDKNWIDTERGFNDSGSASRFFYCAKASKEERDEGLKNIEKIIGHNRFDKCVICGGYILQNPDRPSACKCDNPVRQDNVVKGNYHPTVKPIALMKYLVKLVTKEKQLVLDPFIGSGTTALACMITDRHFIGFDISPEYCDIAKRRIKSPTIKDEIQDNKIKKISLDDWL